MIEYANESCKPIRIDNGSKKAVVYFHGAGAAAGYFLPYVKEAVAAGYDVYAPTYPGHGTKMEDMLLYGPQDWIKCVEELIEELLERYEKVAICGHSLGGDMAAHTAGKYADSGKIEKVLLMCPGFGLREKSFYSMDFSNVGDSGFPFVKDKFPNEELERTSFLYPGMFFKTVKDLIDIGEPCLNMSMKVQAPTTVLYSMIDPICDVALIEQCAQNLPNLVSVHRYTKSGHNILIEGEYADVHQRIVLWLNEEW